MNYKNLDEITAKSQKELDAIPLDFKGRIYIEFGTPFNRAVVKNNYYQSVVACDNSRVVASGNSSVEARENSNVVACGNSRVVAWENSRVEARESSSVLAWGNSRVEAWGNSRVEAWGNSRVEAWENSRVEARENSSVEACGNCQVVDKSTGSKIKISGNARKVFMPKNIFECMDFYGIQHTKKTAIFYKAVRKINNKYVSNWDNSFEYEIGKTKTEVCDSNTKFECSNGIHIAYLRWALDFGKDFEDLAILEVKTNIEDIVMPDYCDGKVRTSKIKILREVPLEECGIYGKILARKLNGNRA